MRLSTTLLVVAAAGLLAVGLAVDQTKISQSQDVAPFEHAAGGKRLLRSVATVNEDDEEERGVMTQLLARFPGTAQNTARKAESETKKIKWFANDYAYWLKHESTPMEVFTSCINAGYSAKKAVKIALRYLKYQENPALYH